MLLAEIQDIFPCFSDIRIPRKLQERPNIKSTQPWSTQNETHCNSKPIHQLDQVTFYRKLVDENQGLSSGNSRLRVLLEEKEHDLSMAQANLASLTQMLEEKSVDSESVQQERLHNLAGELIQSDNMSCR